MGSTANDEMCNLYLMYYTHAKGGSSFGLCTDVAVKNLVSSLPRGNDEPLPPNLQLEEHAHNHFTNDEAAPDKKYAFSYKETPGWPFGSKELGQVTAVDTNSRGHVVVFHRGKHVWNERLIIMCKQFY